MPVQKRVDDAFAAIDFHSAAAQLEDGMNAYLEALNHPGPKVWLHSHVNVDISRSNLSLRVGRQRWSAALGGTDSLYFLMAYHYGLMTLSAKAGTHYPGLSIIDVPGEFSGGADGRGTHRAVEVADAGQDVLAPQGEDRAAQLVRRSQVEGEDVAGGGVEAQHHGRRTRP